MSVFRRRFIILSSHFAAHQVTTLSSIFIHLFKAPLSFLIPSLTVPFTPEP